MEGRALLVYFRKKAGFSTQKSFAKKIGLGIRTYHVYENNPKKITFGLFKKIIEGLELNNIEGLKLYDSIMEEDDV